jgi:hypothetical protein
MLSFLFNLADARSQKSTASPNPHSMYALCLSFQPPFIIAKEPFINMRHVVFVGGYAGDKKIFAVVYEIPGQGSKTCRLFKAPEPVRTLLVAFSPHPFCQALVIMQTIQKAFMTFKALETGKGVKPVAKPEPVEKEVSHEITDDAEAKKRAQDDMEAERKRKQHAEEMEAERRRKQQAEEEERQQQEEQAARAREEARRANEHREREEADRRREEEEEARRKQQERQQAEEEAEKKRKQEEEQRRLKAQEEERQAQAEKAKRSSVQVPSLGPEYEVLLGTYDVAVCSPLLVVSTLTVFTARWSHRHNRCQPQH